jgi:hypothetical protein
MESDSIQNAPGEPQNSRSSRGIWAAVGGAILLVLAKGKFLLVALNSLSAGKLLLTFGSMFAMIDQIAATPKERRRIVINYFGLCAFLAAGTALCAQLMH